MEIFSKALLIVLLIWPTYCISIGQTSIVSSPVLKEHEFCNNKTNRKKLESTDYSAVICTSEGAKSKKWDGIKSGLASGLAAALIKIMLQPFDTVKTLQQIQRQNAGSAAQAGLVGMWSTAVGVCKDRGVPALWSGLGITVLGSTPSTATYFGVYSTMKKFLFSLPVFANGAIGDMEISNKRLIAVAIAAAVGNTVASVLRVPCEVLKQRVQAGQFDSIWVAAQSSWAKDGPLEVFSSGKLSSQIIRDIPYAVITLLAYEALQRYAKILSENRSNRVNNAVGDNTSTACNKKACKDAICGSIAGGLGSLLTTPMDVVKTRLMTGVSSGTSSSVLSTARQIYQEEGIAVFFTGTAPRLMHKIPANGMFFGFYELFKRLLGVSS